MEFDKLKQMPEIRRVMTPFPHWIDLDAPIREAQQMMAVHGIRHLPVMEAGGLVGVVADRDIRKKTAPREGRPADEGLTVRQVAKREAYIVDSHTPLDSVLLEMANRGIGSALVVHQERLAGIFTVTDACRAFGEMLRSRFPPSGGDEAA